MGTWDEQLITVGVADCKTSDRSAGVLITYALGSCIAVMAYDPIRRAGGLLHYMLPNSRLNPEKALESPAMFADTGLELLLNQMAALGCRRRDLLIKAAGGSKLYEDHGTFDIGRRNHVALHRLMLHHDLRIVAEDIGGTISRTARLHLESGRVSLFVAGRESSL